MMKKTAFLVITIFIITACNNNTKQEDTETVQEESANKEETSQPGLEPGCYEYNNNGNNIKMEITEVSNDVKANMNIAYAGKDANQGTFAGKLNGDTLIGTYTFMSEGTQSTREMAFLIKDNQLIEGYGELNEDGTKFNDVNTIKYTSEMPLKKVDCDQ